MQILKWLRRKERKSQLVHNKGKHVAVIEDSLWLYIPYELPDSRIRISDGTYPITALQKEDKLSSMMAFGESTAFKNLLLK